MSPTPARVSSAPLVIAHRGASLERPENTLAAIALARDQRADRIEVDVRCTADGAIVVHHDGDLMRSAGDPRRIDAMKLADLVRIPLSRLAPGTAAPQVVPTLRQAVDAARPIPLLVEIKPVASGVASVADAVHAELVAAGAGDEAAVISFSDAIVERLLSRLGPARVGPIRGSENGADGWRDLEHSRATLVVVSRKIAPPEVVAELVRRGKTVFVYALDDATSVKAYRAANAHGIITNRPALARAVIDGGSPATP